MKFVSSILISYHLILSGLPPLRWKETAQNCIGKVSTDIEHSCVTDFLATHPDHCSGLWCMLAIKQYLQLHNLLYHTCVWSTRTQDKCRVGLSSRQAIDIKDVFQELV